MADKYLKVNLKNVVKITPFENHIEILHVSGFTRIVDFNTQVIYYRKKSKKSKVEYIDINAENTSDKEEQLTLF